MLLINRKKDQSFQVVLDTTILMDEVERRVERSVLSQTRLSQLRDLLEYFSAEIKASSLITVTVAAIEGRRVVIGVDTTAKGVHSFRRLA